MIDQQRKISQVRQRLIVQIARDAPAFGFGFVRQLQTRIGQFAIRRSQCGAGAMNAPILEIAPAQSDQREQQQYRRAPSKSTETEPARR